METIFKNPRNNKIKKPKYVFKENDNEALVRYEDFGSDYIIDKKNGIHKVVKSTQFDRVFDRIN